MRKTSIVVGLKKPFSPFGVLFEDSMKEPLFRRNLNLEVWQKRICGLQPGETFCNIPRPDFFQYDETFSIRIMGT